MADDAPVGEGEHRVPPVDVRGDEGQRPQYHWDEDQHAPGAVEGYEQGNDQTCNGRGNAEPPVERYHQGCQDDGGDQICEATVIGQDDGGEYERQDDHDEGPEQHRHPGRSALPYHLLAGQEMPAVEHVPCVWLNDFGRCLRCHEIPPLIPGPPERSAAPPRTEDRLPM